MNRYKVVLFIILSIVALGGFFTKSNALGYGLVVIELKGSNIDCPCNVVVSFTYPGAPKDQIYKVDKLPAVLRFEFQEELAVMESDYKNLYNGVNEASVILPTIMIIIYDKNGNSAGLLYDTLSYYEEPGNRKELEEKGIAPWSASLSDPFKPFKEGFKIVIDLDKVIMVKDLRFTEKPPRKLPSIGQSCEATFTQPYWNELYDERYNPPEGWIMHIDGEDWKAGSAWFTFAEKYGSAYYYRTDLYSISDALAETQRMLGFGDGTMEELLSRLGYPELDWIDSISKYESVYLEVPWLMTDMYISPEYEYMFTVFATLHVTGTHTYTQGWSFRGKLILGVSKQSPVNIDEAVFISTNGTIRIVIPQMYIYLGDGYIVDYEVNMVDSGSCSYWEVIPYTLFVPRYVVVDLFSQYYSETCIDDCVNNAVDYALSMLYYSSNISIMLDDIIDVTPGTFILEDTSSVSSSYEISGSIVNIYKEWIEFLLKRVLGRYNPVYGFMVGLFMDQFSYTYYIYNDQGVDYYTYLYPNGNFNDVYIRVNKYTSKLGAGASKYSDLVPLHIDYEIYVDVYPDLPCEPYCPRGND